MLRDVFYYGKKPNAHPREKFAKNLADARQQSTTEHFWIINEFCDYTNFDWDWDFDFLPDEDVWAEKHNNVWPSPYQKDSGTWLCTEENSEVIIYRADVDPIPLKDIISDNWKILESIDVTKFDFKWHPDPTDNPYIYVFGNQWYPGTIMPTVEYHVPGATDRKYVTTIIAPLASKIESFTILHETINFDYSWVPDPTSPPYIYVFGNTQYPGTVMPTIEYHVEGATERKYIDHIVPKLAPQQDKFNILEIIDRTKFDFSWVPDPTSPPYIYVFGNTQYPGTVMPTVEYTVPGATDRKYVTDVVAQLLPMQSLFKIIHDTLDFDFSWRPDPTSPPYIYVFGNTQYPGTIMPTVEYHVEGATERKYIDDIVPTLVQQPQKFQVLDNIDPTSFDYSWVPDPTSPPYIYAWGNQWNKPEDKISVQYIVDGATEYRYMEKRVIRKASMDNWRTPGYVVQTSFDYSWEPNPNDPPFIYQFGTQWQKTSGPRYVVDGATEIKYIDVIKATVIPWQFKNWLIPRNIDQKSFDFSWHPDATEPNYIYQFPSQWSRSGGPRFVMDGATQIKYVDNPIAKAKVDMTHWSIPEGIDITDFDFSWHPDIEDNPYVYQFGTQWQKTGGPIFTAPGCGETAEIKYVDNPKAKLKPDMTNWTIPDNLEDFDFSWKPGLEDIPYIYQFGTQWQKTGGPVYTVNGATEIKYVEFPKATIKADKTNWIIPTGFDEVTFDFSWHPDATSPPYIYQFGTVLDDIHLEDGPKYITPNNDGHVVLLENIILPDANIRYTQYYIETTLHDLIEQHVDEIFWALRKNIDYTTFDFNWRPTKEQVFNINTFGSPDSETTQTYLVNGKMWQKGYRDISFIENTTLDEEYLSKLFKQLNAFFVDRGNKEANTRFEQLKTIFPNIQKTRYLNSWVDTINRCVNKSQTTLCWILNSELDYSEFNFDYYPNPWQEKMVHVFGTQWSHWGTTFLVNKESFPEDTKYVKIIEHLNVLNFVKSKKAIATNCLYDIVLIDHGNEHSGEINGMNVTKIKYELSYLNTFKKLLKQLPTKSEHYVWICSSVCDYSNFDFTYICDPYAKDQLHVFPSDRQKFGDTFLVDVNKLRSLIDDMFVLEDYNKINFNQHLRTKRLDPPLIITNEDTHCYSVQTDFDFPYAIFTTYDNQNIKAVDTEPMNLWAPDTKNIIVTSTGGTRIIVPKEAKEYVSNELYDYPYISKINKQFASNPLDIVFLSNGETGADENYEHLLKVTRGLPNRVVRVDGINGRVAAYHAAATASNTPWMFTVFAKLHVNDKFDWSWQPDRLQSPKHYIFYASNPVNGLVYGHQAMIAYNKKITLSNMGKGLDFTLDNEHEVVEANSGIAMYNTDAWSTWRTSFREAIKLRLDDSIDSRYRLKVWSTVGEGDFAQYSINGAVDAVEYYESVNGDLAKLRLSYDWPWLKEYFNNKYN